MSVVTIPKRFFTVEEAANYSGISASSLRRLMAAGTLTAHRPIDRILFDVVELDRVIHDAAGKKAKRQPQRRVNGNRDGSGRS